MEKEFLMQLEENLHDEHFRQKYKEYASSGIKRKNMFLTKVLNYIISTRDFKNLNYYIDNFRINYFDGDYKRCFPYDYLKSKGLNNEESERMIYDNFIKNGFLFHITPSSNITGIMNSGLQTLNDRTQRNMYPETVEVNNIYEKITKRNEGMFYMPMLINIPGGDLFLNENRFNSIYLTSNLDYALKTYGLSSEISTMFVRDFFWAFQRRVSYENMDKEEIRAHMIETLEEHPSVIYDNEIESIIGYFDRIYHEQGILSTNSEQSIVLVPTKLVRTNDKVFDMLYRKGLPQSAPETIIDFNNGEVENKGSISPDDLFIISSTEKILTLHKNNK